MVYAIKSTTKSTKLSPSPFTIEQLEMLKNLMQFSKVPDANVSLAMTFVTKKIMLPMPFQTQIVPSDHCIVDTRAFDHMTCSFKDLYSYKKCIDDGKLIVTNGTFFEVVG